MAKVDPNAQKLIEYEFIVPNTKETPRETPVEELKENPEAKIPEEL